MSEPIPSEYEGWRRIVETSQWVDDGLDILGPALLSLTGHDDRLRMHGLLAYVNCKPIKTGVSFTWEGAWEYDQMSGTGRVTLGKDGRLIGSRANEHAHVSHVLPPLLGLDPSDPSPGSPSRRVFIVVSDPSLGPFRAGSRLRWRYPGETKRDWRYQEKREAWVKSTHAAPICRDLGRSTSKRGLGRGPVAPHQGRRTAFSAATEDVLATTKKRSTASRSSPVRPAGRSMSLTIFGQRAGARSSGRYRAWQPAQWVR